MSFTCSKQSSENCVESDLFDAPAHTPDGDPLCLPCAHHDTTPSDGDHQ